MSYLVSRAASPHLARLARPESFPSDSFTPEGWVSRLVAGGRSLVQCPVSGPSSVLSLSAWPRIGHSSVILGSYWLIQCPLRSRACAVTTHNQQPHSATNSPVPVVTL